MLGTLAQDGVEITNDPALADVVIVNTCSFIDSAKEESVNAVLESEQFREAQDRGQALVVAGCLSQRFRNELPELMPEVDAFMGVDQVAQVTDIVRSAAIKRSERLALQHQQTQPSPKKGASKTGRKTPVKTETKPEIVITSRPVYIPDYTTPRFRLTPKHFAYLKIAEGCNHPCSFCIIPRIRGTHRSRQPSDLVHEAKDLIQSGVKELNLISQDTTYYGMDLVPGPRSNVASPERFQSATRSTIKTVPLLPSLLKELNAIPGNFWIRLLYTHPAHWTDELIDTLAECKKVVRYIDMPLQHIHPVMLERMRRETSREYIEDLIARIRSRLPGITIRTTFIVGFPGEKEEYFQSLLDFVQQTRFERLGIFTYSAEESTPAAKMLHQANADTKKKAPAGARFCSKLHRPPDWRGSTGSPENSSHRAASHCRRT